VIATAAVVMTVEVVESSSADTSLLYKDYVIATAAVVMTVEAVESSSADTSLLQKSSHTLSAQECRRCCCSLSAQFSVNKKYLMLSKDILLSIIISQVYYSYFILNVS